MRQPNWEALTQETLDRFFKRWHGMVPGVVAVHPEFQDWVNERGKQMEAEIRRIHVANHRDLTDLRGLVAYCRFLLNRHLPVDEQREWLVDSMAVFWTNSTRWPKAV